MKSIIEQDLYRYEGERCKSFMMKLRYVLFTPSFTFIYFFRKAQTSRFFLCKLLWKVLHRLAMWHTGIQIPVETQIAPGFRIVHFGTIVVNPGSKIGKNFNISQGALIGNSEGKNNGVPSIGNNVCMQANSIIVGGVTIGNNVLIAPGAFVNFDVPDNYIVIGNPGKIIPRDSSPTAKYIIYSLP
jgi:serine O-acetyltransferase